MKSELKKLKERIDKLSTREQEILRLRYADGLNYKDLAAAANGSQEEVTGLLLGAINSLRGMPGGDDKGRFLAFVHGELNETDTQKMAEWVEADPEARKEFESLLAMSDALTDLYDALVEEKSPSVTPKSTIDKIRETASALKSGKRPAMNKPRLLIAGGCFAVAAAIILYIALDMSTGKDEAPVPEDAAAEAAGASGAESALPEPAPMPEPAPASPPIEEGTLAGAGTPTTHEPPPAAPLDAPAPEPAPAPAPAPKVMMVDAAKTVISKNINKKLALAFLSKKLNSVPSCIPATDKKSKSIKASIAVKKDGTYTSVAVTAPSAGKAAITKCLKAKLGATAKSLKTNNKAGGKITLALKIQ